MNATTPTGFRLQIASPCSASWEGMTGSERVRFCGQCRKNVYNLSALSLDQAHELLAESEGQVCVRFFQRPDGTVLTEDCPVGVAALRRRAQAAIRRTAGAALAVLGMGFAWLQNRSPAVMGSPVPSEIPLAEPHVTMGAVAPVAVPQPPLPPTPQPRGLMGEPRLVMGGLVPRRPPKELAPPKELKGKVSLPRESIGK